MFNKIFDELIEVKCFKDNRLQESYVKYFNPFTPTRYPTWLKKIQLGFC